MPSLDHRWNTALGPLKAQPDPFRHAETLIQALRDEIVPDCYKSLHQIYYLWEDQIWGYSCKEDQKKKTSSEDRPPNESRGVELKIFKARGSLETRSLIAFGCCMRSS